MSSTAVEFGLINTFRTHNVLVDTLLCMLVPLLIQKVVAYVQQSPKSLAAMLRHLLFPPKEERRVSRVIEVKQRFNRWGKVWDYDQKNHLLQKAISLYLAGVLDLKSKNAQYELLEKIKRRPRTTKALLDAAVSESDCSTTGSESSNGDDDDGEYCGEVNRLNVEALPPLNEWIKIEPGVYFKHETVAPESSSGDKKATVKESTVNFRFESALPDASKRIDAIIDRAFRNYQAIERRKHVEDKARYFYVQADTATGSSDGDNNTTPVVAYKRYALGEEKTFDNLFFEEKQQVLQLLDNFASRSGKFAIKGFPYKLGLLLHGPPGTGKTSLIKAIAQYTKRHVVTISLGKIKTNQQLLDALFDMKFAVQGLDSPIDMGFEDAVFVMEDIDCASSIVKARASEATDTKSADAAASDKPPQSDDDKLVSSMIKACLEDEKKYNMRNDKLNLSGLLNVLDGVIDCPGRIVIMTTNHPEKLDPALVRPGRVNKKLLLGYMGCTQIQQMIEYYCVATLAESQVRRLGEAFELSSQTFTPAEIEELCAEHDDVDAVLGGFERLAARH
ncbi:mitochondrial chaperone BCS1-B [Phytophthora cinnamomi]|uniref:mitochondrial chaperone BCS1-B n=1 Tax=Phytophthora cinnamomi TaxID=4785 RepID=UPI00355A0FCC|nr:mitochondrial chaperone BCS1-B [Phytophthora cinnamomi]KAG6576188.1 mitochondrial chaperone BCS1-B [Phytophthora cinnamomi]